MKVLLLPVLLLSSALHSAVKLPSLISDHMVLQAGTPVRIWGKADAGEAVKVEFQGQSVATAAKPDGKWEAWLRPLPGGEGEIRCCARGMERQRRQGQGRGSHAVLPVSIWR